MSSFLIDTNCLISYLTDRNPGQTEKIAEVIEDASNLKYTIYVISNVITELVHAMEIAYRQDSKFISRMLSDLISNPGIEYPHSYNLKLILNLWQTK